MVKNHRHELPAKEQSSICQGEITFSEELVLGFEFVFGSSSFISGKTEVIDNDV